jgi:glycosyltransferase involved in cell wall biosynthesis
MNNASSPTVSVVMPTYNRADLLPKTIASILSQDLEDFELLIVDDGSTDNTAAVIREIQARDARLRYVPLPENRGIGFVRQTGLQHASGKYIALADSDDLWLPGKLKAQVEALEKYPEIDILFSDFWNIDYVRGTEASGFAETQAGMKHLAVRHLADELWLVEGGVEIGILKSNFIAAPTIVLRADVFKKVGGFETALSTPVDYEFGWRAAVLGARYAYINRPLIERYRYQSSVTARKIDTALQKLDALQACYRACKTARRPDLLDHIRIAERRTWRKLIRAYGNSGQRMAAIRAFGSSLQSGVSVRNLIFLIMALLGPRAISFATRVWVSLSNACRGDL